MQDTKPRILIVEDEPDIADLLALHLNDLGATTDHATDGHQGLKAASTREWDLVILDLRLPGIDGLEICRRLRASGNSVPILMLTAKSAELDRILGLEIGADDYVTKPFSVIEVMARVRAILRRVELDRTEPMSLVFDAKGLSINATSREVRLEGALLDLTPREFDLLTYFAAHPGAVYRRSQLLDQVWGYGHEGYEHTVNSHINRLRSKIQPAGAHEFIVTVWGVGYKFVA